MTAILSPGAPVRKSIALQTRAGTHIHNEQSFALSNYDHHVNEQQIRRHDPLEVRLQTSAVYNCHGLCFASRRTRVYEIDDILRLLEEDKYVGVEAENVLPGDVVLYVADDGDIEHSGVVVSPPEDLGIPKVVSKWGAGVEAIHWANRCPYNPSQLRYYRVKE